MPMYNLITYTKTYNGINTEMNLIENPPDDHYNNDPIANSKSFKYKGSIVGKTPNNDGDDNNTNNVEIAASLKYLSNIWRTLDNFFG